MIRVSFSRLLTFVNRKQDTLTIFYHAPGNRNPYISLTKNIPHIFSSKLGNRSIGKKKLGNNSKKTLKLYKQQFFFFFFLLLNFFDFFILTGEYRESISLWTPLPSYVAQFYNHISDSGFPPFFSLSLFLSFCPLFFLLIIYLKYNSFED